jgi:hypothetical protein
MKRFFISMILLCALGCAELEEGINKAEKARNSGPVARRVATPIGSVSSHNGKIIQSIIKVSNKEVLISFTDSTTCYIKCGSTFHASADMNCEIVTIR